MREREIASSSMTASHGEGERGVETGREAERGGRAEEDDEAKSGEQRGAVIVERAVQRLQLQHLLHLILLARVAVGRAARRESASLLEDEERPAM